MMEAVVANRKDQIHRVAQNLFRQRGFSATSMRDLAKAVGIEPASLYSHIASKDQLLQDICFQMAQEFFEALDQSQIPGVKADEQLRMAIDGHIRIILDNLDASAVFFHEWRHLKEPALTEFKELRKQYEERFRSIVREGQEQRVLRDIDEEFITFTLFSSMNRIFEWQETRKEKQPEEFSAQINQLFLEGLRVE